MPNWCEGRLKIRGTKESVLRFFNEGIELYELFGTNVVEHTARFDDWFIEINVPGNKSHNIYVKDTNRGFIENSNTSIYFVEDDEKDEVIAVFDYKQAWTIRVEDFVEISKKFGIDLKIYAFERGMEFNKDIEVVKGEIVKNEIIEFGNYVWECVDPFVGG